MMDRRSFLRSLLGTATAAAVPKVVTYVFAPPGGWALGQRVYSPYIDSYDVVCNEASLINALRKVDPLVGIFFNARCSVEITSHLPGVAFKPALWCSLSIGIVAEHNGVHLPNDYGFKEA